MRPWVVYVARGITPRGTGRIYVGCVRVSAGEEVSEALERRRLQHAEGGTRGNHVTVRTLLKVHVPHF